MLLALKTLFLWLAISLTAMTLTSIIALALVAISSTKGTDKQPTSIKLGTLGWYLLTGFLWAAFYLLSNL